MNFVIDLSRQNIERATGGPFGAAVFDADGRLVAPGVNMVIPQNCSILHAEMVAMALAQKVLGRFDLSDGGCQTFSLFTSTEPCAMCFGAIPWSGVRRLVCGAARKDAEAVGFDEGSEAGELDCGTQAARHRRGHGCVPGKSRGRAQRLCRFRRADLQFWRTPGGMFLISMP